MRWLLMTGLSAACLIVLAAGCWALLWYFEPSPYGAYGADDAPFKDDARTNTQVSADQIDLSFVDRDGQTVRLADFRGKSAVVLIVMRGFPGSVCPNCSAQTSRLIRNHAEFVKRGAEVLMVFPGPTEHLGDFVQAGRDKAAGADVPFRILLDPDFAAVDKLGIRGFLARPSTYIIDKQGQVRFAYVGAYTSDRPSIQAMLTQLDQLTES